MVPVFKSDYSIGKSILTLASPSEDEGPTSIFSLLKSYNQKSLCLVEDSLTGFLEAHSKSTELGIALHFGLRISCCANMLEEIPKGGDSTEHKIVIFALDHSGCQILNQIYSEAFTKGNGRIDSAYLKSLWNEEHLKLAIPFYDSFLFYNLLTFKSCVMDLDFTDLCFFIEDNDLPFDSLLRAKTIQYCEDFGHSTLSSKSIYYASRSDFASYQAYKCICSRASFGRGSSLDKPNLDHCSSSEFCMESWREKTNE